MTHQPTVETRNRNLMRPNPVAPWELRIGDLRVYDEVTDVPKAVVQVHYSRSEENQFLEVIYRSGKRDILFRGDLASGAIIAAVVERAKSLAIKRSIQTRQETQLTREDLLAALQREYQENDLFPATDITEDWLKLTDFDPDNVIKLGPIRPRKADTVGNAIV